MEVAMEVEDDLFFADLSKQISLLIMDDDEADPVANCPSVSLQVLLHLHLLKPFKELQKNFNLHRCSCFLILVMVLFEFKSLTSCAQLSVSHANSLNFRCVVACTGSFSSNQSACEITSSSLWANVPKRKQRDRSFHSPVITAEKEAQTRKSCFLQHNLPKTAWSYEDGFPSVFQLFF